jgi:hypothetical protein
LKKTLLLLLSLFSLGFLVVILFLGNSFININNIEDSLPQIQIGNSKFPVESIFSVTLEVNKNKQIIRRSRENHNWDSSFKSDIINNRLEYISKLRGEIIEPFKNITGVISLKFNNGKSWKGVFNQFYFRWIIGPFKGEGGRLSEFDSYLFSSGRNMFKLDEQSWCETTIKEISGKSTQRGEAVDLWADKNCSTPIDILIDKHSFNAKKFLYRAEVLYTNTVKGEIEWNDGGLFRITSGTKERMFVSKALLSEIKKLNLNPYEGK